MKVLSLVTVGFALLSVVGCGGEGSGSGAPAGSTGAAATAKESAPPADAKTVAAFKDGNPTTGSTAKIHGYVGSNKGNAWVIVDKVGETMPFVFCDMASPPAGVEKGAHVVASGKVEDPAMIKECTITPL
ncbi:MAG: hypothetical protein R3B70_25735 [Polyangiaceae bacterium]